MFPLLRAIFLTAYREIRTLNSIQGNNFFFCVLLISMQPESALFLWTLLGAIMLLPALAAPLARIPAIRLSLWPITRTQASLLGPFTKPETQSSPWLWSLLPILELRQICRTLDFWLALLISLSATAYRFLSDHPQPDAFPILTMIVVLSLSTLAQNLFALDGVGGRLRWKLAPIRGYKILLRKGLAVTAIAVLLTLGLNPVGALAGILAALAVGHHFTVFSPIDSGAWRFTMGQFLPYGFLQVIAMFSCGISSARGDLIYLAIAAAAWVISAFAYGWALERS